MKRSIRYHTHTQAVLEIRDILTLSIPCFYIQINKKKCLNLLEWLLFMTILKLNLSSIMPIGNCKFRMRIRIFGSVPLTNRSGCGSRRPTGPFTSVFKDIKSYRRYGTVEIKGFLTYFGLMMEGSGAGSIIVTKKRIRMRIRITNTVRRNETRI